MGDEALPYRFLRNYEFTKEDIQVFRGRSREAACLFTEITTRHLVVLFAPTGTGEVSLINAAVRPVLEESDYKTIYIKPTQDIRKSIREQLAKENLFDSGTGDLAAQLRARAKPADQPVVLFLDQFEEFFLYSCDQTADVSKDFVQ